LLFDEDKKTIAQIQKQEFESPTGYQKPLTTVGWFFALCWLFDEDN
jgi:hypothetical protein